MNFIIFSTIFIISITSVSFSQEWACGSEETENDGARFVGQTTRQMAIVYVDFNDGRYNNETPQDMTELLQVQNIDAVPFMGYVADPHSMNASGQPTVWNKFVRKYTYEDHWKRFFSDNQYIGSMHPDWQSHGVYGYPLRSAGQIGNPLDGGDTAKGYGSVYDYFKEVSYNNYTIEPAVTHPNEPVGSIYRTGIINNYTPTSGNQRFIIPVKINVSKSNFTNNENALFTNVTDLVYESVRTQINQNNFNIESFLTGGGMMIVVLAGGTNSLGGVHTHISVNGNNYNIILVREKRAKNTPVGSYMNVIEGISVTCHEIGHNLGWKHNALGNLCIMNQGSDNQNCPSHPNMVYKLLSGWIPSSHVKAINTAQDITDLQPSALNNGGYKCATVTVYGKAGWGNSFNHSEFYVVENRRMLRDNPNVKFDKKIVWKRNLVPTTPDEFNGGCLVYRYTGGYNSITSFMPPLGGNETNSIALCSPRFTGANEFHNFAPDEPDSREFYGVTTSDPQTPVFTDILQSRTNSSYSLPTGIQITNISSSNNLINFHVDYLLGPPPDYDFVSFNQNPSNVPLEMHGRIFMHFPCKLMRFNAGSVIDYGINPFTGLAGTQPFIVNGGNIVADGTEQNPIVFQGFGYTEQKTKVGVMSFQGLKSNETNMNQTIFRHCIFKDLTNNHQVLRILNLPNSQSIEEIPIIIENNRTENGLLEKYSVEINSQPNNTIPLVVSSIFGNTLDFTLSSNGNAPTPLIVTGEIEIPSSYSITFNAGNNSRYYFSENSELNIYGSLKTAGNPSNIVFDKLPLGNKWQGINAISGLVDIKRLQLKNAVNGITLTSPQNGTLIDLCSFENNQNQDITVNSFFNENSIIISNNTFTGARNINNIGVSNGISISVYNNTFNDVSPVGIALNNVIDPDIQENEITGVPNSIGINGVLSFSSGGTYNCNEIQSCSNGIYLNNSSPNIYQNILNNNVRGLYVVNASNPILSPSSTSSEQLLNAGYNLIRDNALEEIYCDNSSLLPLSLPVMNDGINQILDEINAGCLINTNLSSGQLIAHQNYWGLDPHPLSVDFCPQGTVDFSNHLITIPAPPTSCLSDVISRNNSSLSEEILLLGSANLDFFNGNYTSAVIKYKNYISLVNSSAKSYLPLSKIFYATALSGGDFYQLENYYSQLASQFNSDSNFSHKSQSYSTASDVEQSSYEEAISEYDLIILNSQNESEVYYAYLDKMRAISLSLLNNNNGSGGSFDNMKKTELILNDIESSINDFISFTPKVTKDRKTAEDSKENNALKVNQSVEISDNLNSSRVNSAYLQNLKENLILENINLTNKSATEIKSILDKVISFKLIEFSLNNHTSSVKTPQFVKNESKANNIVPKRYILYQNYPNPFNPTTSIKYEIPKSEMVTIKIFDLLGKEVFSFREFIPAGQHNISFDGGKYASGVYFYTISAGTFSDTRKMLLLK